MTEDSGASAPVSGRQPGPCQIGASRDGERRESGKTSGRVWGSIFSGPKIFRFSLGNWGNENSTGNRGMSTDVFQWKWRFAIGSRRNFMQRLKYYRCVVVTMVGNNPTSEIVRPLKRDAGINVLDNRTRRGLTQADVDTRLADAPSTHLVRKVAHGYEPKCTGPRAKVVRHDVRLVSNDKSWTLRMDSDVPVLTATVLPPILKDKNGRIIKDKNGRPVRANNGQPISDLTFKFVPKDHSRMDKEGRDAHVLISERIRATGQVIGWASARSLALNVVPIEGTTQYQFTLTACRVQARNGPDGLDIGARPIHSWEVRRPAIYNRAGAIEAGLIPAPQAPAYTGRPQFVKFTGVDYDVDGIAIDYKRFIGRVPPMYAEDN